MASVSPAEGSRSFHHVGEINQSCLDTLNIKIHLLFQNIGILELQNITEFWRGSDRKKGNVV